MSAQTTPSAGSSTDTAFAALHERPPRRGKFRIFKRIVIVVFGLIVLFCIFVSLQPAEYKVTRAISIDAPSKRVFDQINDFHQWDAWSPWAKLDPNIKTTFIGPASGKDSVYAWTGNKEVGEGRMTIIESHPLDHIRISLEFIRPFPDSALTDFNFNADGSMTRVTWTMSGHKNFFSKAFCLFMNMDQMIGKDFEKGLAQMKAVAETSKSH